MTNEQTLAAKLAYFPDSYLRKRCSIVEHFAVVPSFVELMFNTMIVNQGMGLAANQCKLLMNIFVMRTDKIRQAFVNARIIHSEGVVLHKERCLSFPGIEVEKKRAKDIVIEYQDETGQQLSMPLSGIESICAQHEMDHLKGITMVDGCGNMKQRLIIGKVQKRLKDQTCQNENVYSLQNH